jgi:pentatricopeptide repeat protein
MKPTMGGSRDGCNSTRPRAELHIFPWNENLTTYVKDGQSEKATRRMSPHKFTVCNSLIDIYTKCGSIEDAWTVFNKMPS